MNEKTQIQGEQIPTPTPEKAPVNAKEKKSVLEQSLVSRAKSFKSKWLQVALAGAMGIAAESATHSPEAPVIESPVSDTEESRERIRQALGSGTLGRIDRYIDAETDLQKYREELRNREHPRTVFEGFEQLGYSTEQIQQLTTELLPEEWLSIRNVENIVVSEGELPGSYGIREGVLSRAAGRCISSRTVGVGARIELSGRAISDRPRDQRLAYLMRVLVHEIAHANEPMTSFTLKPEIRLWAMDWMTDRSRTLGATSEVSSDIFLQSLRNNIVGFLGDEQAMPAPGEGALPFEYPRSIEFDNERVELARRYQEYFAETAGVILTLPNVEPVEGDKSTWEERVARQLIQPSRYNRIAANWRTDDEAYLDALEHARFVRRLVPDIEEGQARYHALMEEIATNRH